MGRRVSIYGIKHEFIGIYIHVHVDIQFIFQHEVATFSQFVQSLKYYLKPFFFVRMDLIERKKSLKRLSHSTHKQVLRSLSFSNLTPTLKHNHRRQHLVQFHRFTHQKGVHQYRYFLSSMRTPILLLSAHALRYVHAYIEFHLRPPPRVH